MAADADYCQTLRVHWEDTDAGGVVYHANYLRFFDRARTEWLRSLGCAPQALRESGAAVFVVAGCRVRFRAPARLDDLLDVTVRRLAVGGATIDLGQQVLRGGVLLVEGELRLGCVDATHLRPTRIPSPLLRALR